MAGPLEVKDVAEAHARQAAAIAGPAPAHDAGERLIGRVLRTGALCSGALFLLSVVLGALPQAPAWERELFLLRAAAASLLVVAPVVRLIVAGTVLALHREWRYAWAALGILVMLCAAVGLGYSH